jgi:hypothetical protein
MLEVGETVPAWRDTHVGQVAAFAEHAADRVLEAVFSPDLADDRELRPVGRPVGLPHALLDLAGCASAHRHPRQRSDELPVPHVARAGEHGEIALRRGGEQVHPARAERLRLGILGPHREDLGRVARGRGAVHDGLAVAGEGGLEHRLAPEVELAERERLGAGAGAPGMDERSRRDGGKDGSRHPPGPPVNPRTRRDRRHPGA